jgi:hypothetical protein
VTATATSRVTRESEWGHGDGISKCIMEHSSAAGSHDNSSGPRRTSKPAQHLSVRSMTMDTILLMMRSLWVV